MILLLAVFCCLSLCSAEQFLRADLNSYSTSDSVKFGLDISLDGTRLAVLQGHTALINIYEESTPGMGDWAMETPIFSHAFTILNVYSLSLADMNFAFSAYFYNGQRGIVYVCSATAPGAHDWNEAGLTSLTNPTDAVTATQFGIALEVASDGTIFVGANSAIVECTVYSPYQCGSVFVFSETSQGSKDWASNYVEVFTPDFASWDKFGSHLSTDGRDFVATAPHLSGDNSRIYAYWETTPGANDFNSNVVMLQDPDPFNSTIMYGYSVSIHSVHIVTTAESTRSAGVQVGAIWVYTESSEDAHDWGPGVEIVFDPLRDDRVGRLSYLGGGIRTFDTMIAVSGGDNWQGQAFPTMYLLTESSLGASDHANNITRLEVRTSNGAEYFLTEFDGDNLVLSYDQDDVGPYNWAGTVMINPCFEDSLGDWPNCVPIDQCDSSPCAGEGCLDGLSSYTCYCLCQNGGTCVGGAADCNCTPDYVGELCDIPCPCVNGGTCNNDQPCDCPAGYSGDLCDIEYCDSSPCMNGGTCIQSELTCACTGTGYEGSLCENDVDDCASDPCHNSLNCTDALLSYECTCQPGYTGAVCTQDINDCASSPCLNGGDCIDMLNSFVCDCMEAPGFEGDLCTDDADDCASNPCDNGGTCIDTGLLNYTCACTTRYTGTKNCSTRIDECATNNPCLNGGKCAINGTTGEFRKCSCEGGFSGNLCGNACANGVETSVHVRETGANLCDCTDSGFVGELCELSCGNGTSIFDTELLESFCDCSNTGRTGTLCDIDIDDCASSPCWNNFPCIDSGVDRDSFVCNCSSVFGGTFCETPCENGGSVNETAPDRPCNCAGTGFRGTNCDVDVDECENERYSSLCLLPDSCQECKEADNITEIANCFQCVGQNSFDQLCAPKEACVVTFQTSFEDEVVYRGTREEVCTSKYSLGVGVDPICNECALNHYRRDDGFCIECPAQKTGTWVAVILIGLALIIFFLYISSFGGTLFKMGSILFNFYQLADLNLHVDLTYSKEVKSVQRLMTPLSFNFDSFGGPSCLFAGLTEEESYAMGLIGMIALPVIVFILLSIGHWLRVAFPEMRKCIQKENAPRVKPLAVRRSVTYASSWRVMIQFLNIAYMPIVTKSWGAQKCVDLADGSSVLETNYAVSCTSNFYVTIVTIAYVSLLLYGVGIPVLLLHVTSSRPRYLTVTKFSLTKLVLQLYEQVAHRDKQTFHAGKQVEYELAMTRWMDKFSPLTSSFQYNDFYWSVVIIARGFSLALVPGLLGLDGVMHAQVLLAITIVFLIVHWRESPYLSPTLNYFERVTLGASAFMLVSGIITTYATEENLKASQEYFDTGAASKDAGSIATITGYLILTAFVIVVLTGSGLALKASKDRKQRDKSQRVRAKNAFYPPIALIDPIITNDEIKDDETVYDIDHKSQAYKMIIDRFDAFRHADHTQDKHFKLDGSCSLNDESGKALFFAKAENMGTHGSAASIPLGTETIAVSCQHVEKLYAEITAQGNTSKNIWAENKLVEKFLHAHRNPWAGIISDTSYVSIMLQSHAADENSKLPNHRTLFFVLLSVLTVLLVVLFSTAGFLISDIASVTGIAMIIISLAASVLVLKFLVRSYVSSVRQLVEEMNEILADIFPSKNKSHYANADFIWQKGTAWDPFPCLPKRDSIFTALGAKQPAVYLIQHTVDSDVEAETSEFQVERKEDSDGNTDDANVEMMLPGAVSSMMIQDISPSPSPRFTV